MLTRAGGEVDSLSSTAGPDKEQEGGQVGISVLFQQIVQNNGQWLCDQCGKDLRTESESIGCDSTDCNKWFHPSCLTDKTYLNKNKWYCHLCPTNIQTNSIDRVIEEAKEKSEQVIRLPIFNNGSLDN